jgi:hypothetical protein
MNAWRSDQISNVAVLLCFFCSDQLQLVSLLYQLYFNKCLERYFIALSFAPKLEEGVLEDLMKRSFKGQEPLVETLTYTGTVDSAFYT